MESKKPWQSKTIWASLIVAIAAFFPPISAWISQNPEMFATVLTALFVAIRFITNGKIVISDDNKMILPK